MTAEPTPGEATTTTALEPNDTAHEPEPPAERPGDAEPRELIWRIGRFVCVHEADTIDMNQAPPREPVGACKNWPGEFAVDFVQRQSMCGPCGFQLDAGETRRERAATADACCYEVNSPPPPPPPPPPPT
jgi:hypothetical protein